MNTLSKVDIKVVNQGAVRKPYQKPAIVFEMHLEVSAGGTLPFGRPVPPFTP